VEKGIEFIEKVSNTEFLIYDSKVSLEEFDRSGGFDFLKNLFIFSCFQSLASHAIIHVHEGLQSWARFPFFCLHSSSATYTTPLPLHPVSCSARKLVLLVEICCN
jgi:hypothetical protein